MDKLSPQRIEELLAEHDDWALNGDTLQRTFNLPGFRDAIEFVNHVAELAEDAQHHPDIMIRFNKVTLTLTTHDSGGLTERDFRFAAATDEMLVQRET